MMLMKRDRGSKVTPLLSAPSEGRRSGRQERVSGPASSFLGTWIILRSKSARSMSQCACRRLSDWGWWK